MSPTLAIAVPTLNRRGLLSETLRLLIAQLPEAEIEVSLCVSDNASDDGTHELFAAGGEFETVRYHRHENRVGIDESFRRTVELAKGNFILLFGDDDIPLPGFLKEVTRALRKSADAGFLYVNRLIGDMSLKKTAEVAHEDCPFGSAQILEVGEFIERFTHWPGFVTSLVFSRRTWEEGLDAYSERFDGYSFLARVYWGARKRNAIYVPSPLLIQRRGVLAWKKEWPRYWLLSMPRMLRHFDMEGITQKAVANWLAAEVTTLRFSVDCFVAKAYGYAPRAEFWSESRSFQPSLIRRIISLGIEWFLPSVLAKALYSKSPKMT